MKYFGGCNKAFCKLHGLGHYSNMMIDKEFASSDRMAQRNLSDEENKLF
tara:strand:+ start:457 stop:603 length:147 start_codon:yes stop_codon:yes gene_type:complete